MAAYVPEWEGVPPRAGRRGFFSRLLFSMRSLFSPARSAKETPAAPALAPKSSFHQRLNALLPPHRRYCGRSGRTLLLILAALLGLLALILGLSIGLSHRSASSPTALPLPTSSAPVTGDLTYYETGMGACGIISSDSDAICAISHAVFDAAATTRNPNENPLCGRRIRVRRRDERKQADVSIDVTVVDRCEACLPDDLDLSPSAFSALADPDLGRVKGTWAWLP